MGTRMREGGAPSASSGTNTTTSVAPKTVQSWTWIPVANEQLVIASGCTEAPRGCGLVVARPAGDAGGGEVLVSVATGKDPPEVTRGADARHIRVRALDQVGIYSRQITYLYGRVDLGNMKRP